MKMPYSIDAEMSVLGAILSNDAAWSVVEPMLSADDFYQRDHSLIFSAAAELRRDGQACDVVTVVNRLRIRGDLREAGGPEYLGQLAFDGTVGNLQAHAEIVSDNAKRRRLITLCHEAYHAAVNTSAEDVVAMIEMGMARLGRGAASKALHVSETIHLTELAVQEARKTRLAGGATIGVPTGIRALDGRTGGLCPRRSIVIAARPGVGKTALANQIALHAATCGHPGLIVSCEMGQEELGARALSNAAGVNLTKLTFGFPEEVERASVAGARVGGLPIWIDTDTYGLSAICAQISHFRRAHGIQWAFVDHIGLVETDGYNNRTEQLGAVTRAFKKLAKRLEIPIVQLCQLNRAVEREKRRPTLADLRDSGNIEENADVVLFLHTESEDAAPIQRIELGLCKNRSGRKGWLIHNPLDFDGSTQRFTEVHTYSE